MLRNLTVMLAGVILLGAGCGDATDEGDASEQDVAAQLFAKASAEPFGCEGSHIALQTHNEKNYVTAVAGGSLGIFGNATKVDKFETFKAYDLGFGRVALQAFNGRFVAWGSNGQQSGNRSQQGRGGDGRQADVTDFLLSASSFAIDANATFRITRSKDGEWVSLQAVDGRFVGAPNGGGSVLDVAWPLIGENQQFKAVCVDTKDGVTSNGGTKPGKDDDVTSAGPGLGG